jgi:hypothetical protein
MPRPAFLDLPERAVKPRRAGITHVLDAGLPLRLSLRADTIGAHQARPAAART